MVVRDLAAASSSPTSGTPAITASAGVIEIPRATPPAGPEELLAAADRALYTAKETGRDKVVALDSATAGEAPRGDRVTEAIASRSFILHEQPIIDLETGDLMCRELLVRLAVGNDRLLCPDEFMGVTERVGGLPTVDEWVLGRALKLIAATREEGPLVHVNLSPAVFADPGRSKGLLQALTEHAGDAPRLAFELDERSSLQHLDEAAELTRALAELGCSVVLDHFGAHAASIRLLRALACDLLKIDGPLVRGLGSHGAVDAPVVRAITLIGHELGKKVVAGWVEDERTAMVVRDLGVDLAQGYYYGRPVPVEIV